MTCKWCGEKLFSDDDAWVHLYIFHPGVNGEINKMLTGEPHKIIEPLEERKQ
jgi:hypothetical protein